MVRFTRDVGSNVYHDRDTLFRDAPLAVVEEGRARFYGTCPDCTAEETPTGREPEGAPTRRALASTMRYNRHA